MRIVAGRFGGRRIEAPRGTKTRPTSDRVREALFSVLGDVTGLAVLDLFAGSGALGLEALSRGASRATFVERDPAALRALEANLAALGVEADVRRADARTFARNASATAAPYDLIFVDPPYRDAPALSRELDLGPLLTATGRIVTESHRNEPLEIDLPTTFERRYGDTVIRIHAH
ncbi:MAG TPA: 16S rRNA (guanine(966)-N(2))-methyltransferase RsmD [Solirubrobacteraceae bacterium]|nr:16S rRNA (guanine(966)-N(2))-methyltransferase RsmD [Solirubrobacteraceae bacterium]